MTTAKIKDELDLVFETHQRRIKAVLKKAGQESIRLNGARRVKALHDQEIDELLFRVCQDVSDDGAVSGKADHGAYSRQGLKSMSGRKRSLAQLDGDEEEE